MRSFIFFTKAGEYTREEFEVARKKFEETGKPKIYTYFRVINDETDEQSLCDFMNELDKVFGYYYGIFEHIDTVKLKILLSLKLQGIDIFEIKSKNGNCMIDGYVSICSKDNLIICRDFGFIFDDDDVEKEWLAELEHLPYIILWIDGNHENFKAINKYPVELWNGGKIHRIRKNILHLMRGQIFVVDGYKIFTMGRDYSIDVYLL